MKIKISLFTLLLFLLLGSQFAGAKTVITGQQANTLWGKNVYVFDPKMNMTDIQTILNAIYSRQSGKESEFTKNRYALFFKPGKYNLDVKVGYYMQVYGLGESPDDVVIFGAVRSKSTQRTGNVLSNFWRSAENLAVIPTVDSANIWGVSQAAPLRRIHIKGDLQLHDGGYASGGFLADSKIDGTVYSGQQQQWFSRNTNWGKWHGGAWNMMFMGVPNAPEGNWPEKPFTVIPKTPVIREKPYLVLNGNRYELVIPQLKKNSASYEWKNAPTDERRISLDQFYIANPEKDNSESINSALKKGKNILFSPGIYQIDKAIEVNRPGTIIMGIGLATLQSENGNSILKIADVDGVTICSLMFDAGKTNSENLVQVGETAAVKNHEKNPTVLFDTYFRVGGPFEGSASSCLVINSNNVIVDNTWLWRADHGNGVGWDKNKCANGLIVNGDNVTAYGLFNEHFQEYQTVWNGNNGKVYFYQSEMPYDPPIVDAWKHGETGGYASYKVSDKVTKHEAWGIGVYCVFRQCSPIVNCAIETPELIENSIHHAVTFWLSGNNTSVIKHILNNKGDSVFKDHRKATLD